MKKVSLGGASLLIDEAKTHRFYEKEGRSFRGCQCDRCTNDNMTVGRFMPRELFELLRELGLEPHNPIRTSFDWPLASAPPGMVRRVSHWYLFGKIVTPDPTPILEMAGTRIWASTEEDKDRKHRRLNFPRLRTEGLIYLKASNCLPWLIGELRGRKSKEGDRECSECGGHWREVGILPRGSRIPIWYRRPDLIRLVWNRRKRVRASICTRCGNLEYEVLEAPRPYPRPNRAERRVRNRWQRIQRWRTEALWQSEMQMR